MTDTCTGAGSAWRDAALHGAADWGGVDERRTIFLDVQRDKRVPRGPTEEGQVEELASISRRKYRLWLAEAVAHRNGVCKTGQMKLTVTTLISNRQQVRRRFIS